MFNLKNSEYLICERRFVFELLILSAGMMGAYTFNLRGGVFCNAQTANFVMMSIAFGKGLWKEGFYYLIPISAYLFGAIISEFLPKPVKTLKLLRWDTYLIGFEIFILILCGFIPLTASNHIVQVLINFICSMQYNTFRQAEHVPMATTFCTNHLRQTGIWLVKFFKTKSRDCISRIKIHVTMIVFFFTGGLIQTIACVIIKEKAIWIASIPLFVNFFMMIYADRITEKNALNKIPSGH